MSSWLDNLSNYIQDKSFGLAAIRVMDYNMATFGIIEPYGYYLINYNGAIYLMRESNVAIKFYVRDGTKVVTAIVQTGQLTIGYIDALFQHPPPSSSQLHKFVLYSDDNPRKYSAIQLINRCLDLRIFTF